MKEYDPQVEPLTHYLFFTGKGGVGKTTTASATAVALADMGKKVMLVSTDPASNLQDVFGTELTNKPRELKEVPGLFLANFDPVEAAAEYRENVVGPYRGVLPAVAISNMEEQLSGSCTVEIASFNEFAGFLTDLKIGETFDHIIFDTAPTGHALRMLQLPSAWSSYLEGNERGASCLGQLSGLGEKKTIYENAVKTLVDSERTTLMLVSRPQRASLSEAARASKELEQIGMVNQRLILNGVLVKSTSIEARQVEEHQESDIEAMPTLLQKLSVSVIPLRSFNVMGVSLLRDLFRSEKEFHALHLLDNKLTAEYPHAERIVDSLVAEKKHIVFTMGKGGVGKTSVAVQIARQLDARGKSVRLATTDPADHLSLFDLEGTNIRVSHVNEKKALEAYRQEVLSAAEQSMGSDDVDYVAEDLRSPCTQEIAVFREFADIVSKNDADVVVIDTAPTGHTLLLLDSTQEYAKEVERTSGSVPQSVIDLLPKLQDSTQTEIIMVTLPETTPVLESLRLSSDLDRAQMAHTWWVVNQSMLAARPKDAFLRSRAENEQEWIERVNQESSGHYAVIAWNPTYEKLLTKAI